MSQSIKLEYITLVRRTVWQCARHAAECTVIEMSAEGCWPRSAQVR
jgi:hypothetical protein